MRAACLPASPGTSFVRDHRFLGRRLQPLGMERVDGTEGEGMTSFSQSVSVVREDGISREFDDEDGVSCMRCVASVALGARCIRLVIELKCVTHAHTHTHTHTASQCDNDE